MKPITERLPCPPHSGPRPAANVRAKEENTLNTYETLVWLHVSFAVLWVGGSVMLNIMALRARAGGDPSQMAALFRNLAWFGERYFMPVSLLTLVFGFWLTHEGNWGYSDNPWIVVALAIYVVAFFLGMLFLGPESKRIVRQLDAGPATPDGATVGRMMRYFNVAHLDASALLVILFLMSVKPMA